MIILNWNFLNKESRGKSLEEITLNDFIMPKECFYKANFVAFVWNDEYKILKNRDGKIGIFSVGEFKSILDSKFVEVA